jgi:hypothetical protein
MSSDDTLPALLDILRQSNVQSLHMRLSGEHWLRLPVAFQASIRSLIGSPSMVDVDFTGFDVVDTAIFKHCRSLRRLKFSENFELVVEKDSDAGNAWPATLSP